MPDRCSDSCTNRPPTCQSVCINHCNRLGISTFGYIYFSHDRFIDCSDLPRHQLHYFEFLTQTKAWKYVRTDRNFSALGGTTGSIITGNIFQHYGGQTAFYFSLIPIFILMILLFLFYRIQKNMQTLRLLKDYKL